MDMKTDGKRIIFTVLAGLVSGFLCAFLVLEFLFRMNYQTTLPALLCLIVVVGFLPALLDRIWRNIASVTAAHILSLATACLISLLYVHTVALDFATSGAMDREVLTVFAGAAVIEAVIYIIRKRRKKEL